MEKNPFVQVARDVVNEWRRTNFDDSLFLDASRASLLRVPHLSLEHILKAARSLGRNDGGRASVRWDGFGEQRFVYRINPRFRLELIFWFDNITSVHDHGTDLNVLRIYGHSLESRYDFHARLDATGVQIGRLEPVRVRFDGPGDLQTIPKGPIVIHQVIPIARPAISLLVVREPQRASQHDYYGPLAVCTSDIDPELDLICGTIAAAHCCHTRRGELVRRILSGSSAIQVLTSAIRLRTTLNVAFDEELVLQHLESRDSQFAEELSTALEIARATRAALVSRHRETSVPLRMYQALAFTAGVFGRLTSGSIGALLPTDSEISSWEDSLSEYTA